MEIRTLNCAKIARALQPRRAREAPRRVQTSLCHNLNRDHISRGNRSDSARYTPRHRFNVIALIKNASLSTSVDLPVHLPSFDSFDRNTSKNLFSLGAPSPVKSAYDPLSIAGKFTRWTPGVRTHGKLGVHFCWNYCARARERPTVGASAFRHLIIICFGFYFARIRGACAAVVAAGPARTKQLLFKPNPTPSATPTRRMAIAVRCVIV